MRKGYKAIIVREKTHQKIKVKALKKKLTIIQFIDSIL
jgi:hypothetical protein